jgi:hypothetical protein
MVFAKVAWMRKFGFRSSFLLISATKKLCLVHIIVWYTVDNSYARLDGWKYHIHFLFKFLTWFSLTTHPPARYQVRPLLGRAVNSVLLDLSRQELLIPIVKKWSLYANWIPCAENVHLQTSTVHSFVLLTYFRMDAVANQPMLWHDLNKIKR